MPGERLGQNEIVGGGDLQISTRIRYQAHPATARFDQRGVVGGWFAVRALYHRGRMPIAKQLDEIGGAIFGLLWVALILSFQLVVLDSYYVPGAETTGFLGSYYEAMNASVIVTFFRDTLIPGVGYLARPFVPDEIATLLLP